MVDTVKEVVKEAEVEEAKPEGPRQASLSDCLKQLNATRKAENEAKRLEEAAMQRVRKEMSQARNAK